MAFWALPSLLRLPLPAAAPRRAQREWTRRFVTGDGGQEQPAWSEHLFEHFVVTVRTRQPSPALIRVLAGRCCFMHG